MDTDVLFEDAKTANRAVRCLRSRGLLQKLRFLISPEKPEGLEAKGFMLLFPYVFRGYSEEKLLKLLERERPERVLIRNFEELGFLKDTGYKGEIHADSCLYSFNKESIRVYKELGVREFVCPEELNIYELKERGLNDSVLKIYGRTPLMVSAQCTNKTVSGKCERKAGGFLTEIRDRKKAVFPVRAECGYCYNVIYNSVPLMLFKETEELRVSGLSAVRLDFTVEAAEEAADIIEYFIMGRQEDLNKLIRDYTKGHFRKGVE